jgi:hypothetical protein
MKLKNVLKLHDQYRPPQTLRQNFGDGYLLERNPVYRNIRAAAVEFGFRFSLNRFHDYDTMSLTQLPMILKTKTIPYHDNVRPLRAIERLATGSFKWDDLPPLKSNYVFHESAHAIAHFLGGVYAQMKKPSDQTLILRALLDESFANACESLAHVFVNDETDRLILTKNSYIAEKNRVREDLIRSANTLGLSITFKVLLLSFLHANFLQTQLSAKIFTRVLKLVGSKHSPKEMALLKKVFRVGLDLDPEFTVFTNGFCLKLLGVKKRMPQALQFDFLKRLETDEALQILLSVMTEVVAPE